MAKTFLRTWLDQRSRDRVAPKRGQIREKRADTKVQTLRKEYGPGFARGFRPDERLGVVRQKTGKSLHQLVRAAGRQQVV